MTSEFTERVIEVILAIPRGRVMTYGGVAKDAGDPRRARQVVRILHSCSEKYDLPWHRIVNAKGKTAFAEQDRLLMEEGVGFRGESVVDLREYGITEQGIGPRDRERKK